MKTWTFDERTLATSAALSVSAILAFSVGGDKLRTAVLGCCIVLNIVSHLVSKYAQTQLDAARKYDERASKSFAEAKELFSDDRFTKLNLELIAAHEKNVQLLYALQAHEEGSVQ